MNRGNRNRALMAKSRGFAAGTIELRQKAGRRADGAFALCPVIPCGRPPQARAGQGVSDTYCRFHVQAFNRHGCHWKKTYAAADLRPFRAAARRFLRANALDQWVRHALFALDETLRTSGPNERIVDTYRMAPADKARAALARMSRRGVPAESLLVNYLAVCCAIEADPVRPGSEAQNYRLVQAAKACARLASTTNQDLPPRHRRYARSSGRMLVYLGRTLEECCEHVAGHHLAAIMALASATASRGGAGAVTR